MNGLQRICWKNLIAKVDGVRITVWFIAVFLGAILLFTGSQHLTNQYFFLVAVIRYDMVPLPIAAIVAALIPPLELAIAATLILPGMRAIALAVSGILFFVFATVQAIALASGLKIECGCFGPWIESNISIASVTTVYGLSLAAGAVLYLHISQPRSLVVSVNAHEQVV